MVYATYKGRREQLKYDVEGGKLKLDIGGKYEHLINVEEINILGDCVVINNLLLKDVSDITFITHNFKDKIITYDRIPDKNKRSLVERILMDTEFVLTFFLVSVAMVMSYAFYCNTPVLFGIVSAAVGIPFMFYLIRLTLRNISYLKIEIYYNKESFVIKHSYNFVKVDYNKISSYEIDKQNYSVKIFGQFLNISNGEVLKDLEIPMIYDLELIKKLQ